MIINHYAGSEEMGMEYRPYYLAKNWIAKGHHVIIVCASFSHMRRKNPMIGQELKEEIQDGVLYVYINTPTYTQTGTTHIGKMRNIYSFVRKLNKYSEQLSERYTPDVVISSSTYPFDYRAARHIARMSGARLIYEIRDLIPLSLCELYHYKYNSIIVALGKYTQKRAVKNADAVVSVVCHADRYLREIGIKTDKFYFIPNGTNTKQEKSLNYPKLHVEIIEKYRSKGKFVILYQGGFSETNRVDILIEAAKKLNAEVEIILVGNGLERVALKKMVAQAHLNNVHFLDSVPKTCQEEVMKNADCLYMGVKNSSLYDYGFGMNKIYDYLLSGRPILLATDNNENPVTAANCGIIVKADDISEVIKGIKEMKSLSKEERDRRGSNGRDYCIKYFDYQNIAQQFLDVMENLTIDEASTAQLNIETRNEA